MNSKQIIEALENGGWIVQSHGGHHLIRYEGDKGRKLSDISYWAVYKAVKLVQVDGVEKIAQG